MAPPKPRYVVRCQGDPEGDFESIFGESYTSEPFKTRQAAENRAALNNESPSCPHDHQVVEQVWKDGRWQEVPSGE